MKLEHTFEVSAPIETVWQFLLDLEQVAPCLPGGERNEKVDDRNYKASVKVKLGPMQLAYRGDITITEADEAERRTVVEAKATETRGQGTARATITTALVGADGDTRATVTTDLQLTGRVAQMGRGIVQDVSNRLMGEFAQCLSERAGGRAPPDVDPAPARDSDDRPTAAARPAKAKPIGGVSLVLHVLLSRLRALVLRTR